MMYWRLRIVFCKNHVGDKAQRPHTHVVPVTPTLDERNFLAEFKLEFFRGITPNGG